MLFFTYLRYIYPVDGYSAVHRLNNPESKPHLNLVSGTIQNTRIRVRENAARITDPHPTGYYGRYRCGFFWRVGYRGQNLYKSFGHLLVSLNIISLRVEKSKIISNIPTLLHLLRNQVGSDKKNSSESLTLM